MPLTFRERLEWRFRLLVFPRMRVAVHLPVKAATRTRGWVEFTPDLHDLSIEEIAQYLGDRFGGVTSEILVRHQSRGLWAGLKEENLVIYTDVDLQLADVEWFRKMRKTVWQERFDQYEIYGAIFPVWQ
jgi:hypothetical protein